ncbi:hypothetical protein M0805_001446 [Coniferiporia weirii]|nr:hypothetical protein M0805_001446 [Coniferiporia weirii]
MAHQYFPTRPSRRYSITYRDNQDDELTGDLEQSIFIFPSPGSSPSSPMSIQTDVSFPSTTTTRGRRSSSVSGRSEYWEAISGRSFSTDTALRSPLVEIWEMSDEEDASPVLPTGAVEGTSRPGLSQHRPQQRFPLGKQPFPDVFTYADGRYQFRGRNTLASSVRAKGRIRRRKKSTSLPRLNASQATCRLPMLSFLSALFSLDDGTRCLLTRPSHPHVSPLFPGARFHPAIQDDDSAPDEKRLFSSSELEGLKRGIEVATDASIMPDSVLALPFACIWNLVGDVWQRSRE